MVFFIALVPAALVFAVSICTSSRSATIVAAIIAALFGIFSGNPTYMALDLIFVGIAVWLAFAALPAKHPSSPKGPSPKPASATKTSTSGDGSGFVWLIAIGGVLWFALSGPSKQSTQPVAAVPSAKPAPPVAQPPGWKPNTVGTISNKTSASPVNRTPQAEKRQPLGIDHAQVNKSADLASYRKRLQRLESDHPELNPDLPGYREDLAKILLERLSVHERSGYSKSKALDMAVFDVGMSSGSAAGIRSPGSAIQLLNDQP